MTITSTFNRPKLNTSLATSVPLSSALFEVNGNLVLDIYSTETNDASASVSKLLCRYIITPTIVGNNITFTATPYVFNGSEPSWVTGGNTPTTGAGVLGNTTDLNVFLNNLGIANKNA